VIEKHNRDTEGTYFARQRLFRTVFRLNVIVFTAKQPKALRTEDQSDMFRDCVARSVSQARAKVV
jgi:hypothetical protein